MFEIKTELTKKKKERQKNTLNFFFIYLLTSE